VLGQRRLPLRVVVFGGEALRVRSLQPWLARYGDDRPQLINMYGITEITVHATYHRVTAAEVQAGRDSIGRPLSDLRIHVLDGRLRELPVGIAGELCVSGAGVASGYLGRPELTAERFVTDPIAVDGTRMYRSGDRGRLLASGDLEFLGRADDQVKIRGFRIEPAEIEAVLARHESISRAVVVRAGDGASAVLLAYVVPRHEQVAAAAVLKAFAATQLPEHMVPHRFIPIQSVPLTANGKIDRASLKANDTARPTEPAAAAAPATPRHQVIAEVWKDVLQVPSVGIHDNFFELGGHSLLMARVRTRLESLFACSIPMASMFEAATIDGLARLLESPASRRAQPGSA
jgi:acyl-CoA synthetase (AMP-forming)/AMP-acid ligase II